MVPESVAKEVNIQWCDFTFYSFFVHSHRLWRLRSKGWKQSLQRSTGTQKRSAGSCEESQYCSSKKHSV